MGKKFKLSSNKALTRREQQNARKLMGPDWPSSGIFKINFLQFFLSAGTSSMPANHSYAVAHDEEPSVAENRDEELG